MAKRIMGKASFVQIQDLSGRLQLFLQQPGGGLSAGDDVVGLGGEAHLTQVLGDFGSSAGGVVGDE